MAPKTRTILATSVIWIWGAAAIYLYVPPSSLSSLFSGPPARAPDPPRREEKPIATTTPPPVSIRPTPTPAPTRQPETYSPPTPAPAPRQSTGLESWDSIFESVPFKIDARNPVTDSSYTFRVIFMRSGQVQLTSMEGATLPLGETPWTGKWTITGDKQFCTDHPGLKGCYNVQRATSGWRLTGTNNNWTFLLTPIHLINPLPNYRN